jgi:regulator of protease activity HflC (stomatin/prohibitin superfamily)
MTRKVGKSPPSGTFMVERKSEYQGIIRELLEPGLYYMNPYEFAVQLAEPILIPDGFVGVIVSRTGKPAPVEQLLVEEGFRGVRQDYLKPGIYDINPYEFEIIPIDTRPQTYAITSVPDQADNAVSDGLAFLSNDGFRISIDATVRYKIQPENAPYMVATLGRNVMDDIRTKIIRPGIRSFVRLEGSMRKATEFISDGTRMTFQDSLAAALQAEGARAKITIINVVLSNYTLPEEVTKQAP